MNNYDVEKYYRKFYKSHSLPAVGLELLNLGLLGRRLIHYTTKFLLRDFLAGILNYNIYAPYTHNI